MSVEIGKDSFCLQCFSTDLSLDNDKKSSVSHRREKSSRPKARTKQCHVCYDDKPTEDFKPSSSSRCKHKERSICNACLYQHVKQVNAKMCTDQICCPELNCGIVFKYQTIQRVLLKNNDRALWDKYDRFIVHRNLEKMRDFIWCAHACGMGQLNDGGHRNNIVTCVKCRQKTCFTHKTAWHEGLTCKEYDLAQNTEHQACVSWIAQNAKACPKCACRIEKADGCDHMTCSQCRHEFCWSCLADYNRIRRDGNHRHDPACKHYAAYEEERRSE